MAQGALCHFCDRFGAVRNVKRVDGFSWCAAQVLSVDLVEPILDFVGLVGVLNEGVDDAIGFIGHLLLQRGIQGILDQIRQLIGFAILRG